MQTFPVEDPDIDDCFRQSAPRLSHSAAVERLKVAVGARLGGFVEFEIGAAVGCTLAHAVTAPFSVPAHTNAAVDGYAFSSANYDLKSGPIDLTVMGRAAAGAPMLGHLDLGQAARIFTGAVIPSGADTVVMQEDVTLHVSSAAAVLIPPGVKPGANVRRAGEDVAVGETLFPVGHRLRAPDLAALASLGLSTVLCRQPLRVALVSTGDEVVPVGTRPLAHGQVYDANAPMLGALTALAGCEIAHQGIWPDDRSAVTTRLANLAQDYDVILTTGGASMGEGDHLAAALGEIGRRHVWQIAIKPGRPMMFGQIASSSRNTIVIGLPGNPVAAFVCFLMYVYPLLRALSGGLWPEPRRFLLPALFDFKGRKQGRREFWRARSIATPNGLAVEKYARDGSGLISGLRWCDGLIEIPEDAGDVKVGDAVTYIPLTEFGIVAA